jgi:hypothetical protein
LRIITRKKCDTNNNVTLIFRCIDSKSRPTISEKIFLGLGTLLFFAVGNLNPINLLIHI